MPVAILTKTTDLSSSIQYGLHAGGDIAGRDINKNIVNYGVPVGPCPVLKELSQTLASELEGKLESSEILARLQHYTTQVVNEEVIGLAAKLEEANMTAILKRAEREKEAFSKRLTELQFFPAAQKAFAHLLSEVYSRFNHHVLPKLEAGAGTEAIHVAIQEGIISPIAQKIGDSPLQLYQEEINGMLFFLTGNCHIRWKAGC